MKQPTYIHIECIKTRLETGKSLLVLAYRHLPTEKLANSTDSTNSRMLWSHMTKPGKYTQTFRSSHRETLDKL